MNEWLHTFTEIICFEMHIAEDIYANFQLAFLIAIWVLLDMWVYLHTQALLSTVLGCTKTAHGKPEVPFQLIVPVGRTVAHYDGKKQTTNI
jgi:hypothetical protein